MERSRRKIFSIKELENNIIEKGYVVIKSLISKPEIKELTEFYHSLSLDKRSGFHVSNYNTTYEVKKAVSSIIRSVIEKKIISLFNNYKTLTGFYYVKEANDSEDFYTHLDWNIVNELNFDSLSVWVPLIDINENNGALVMFEGSHNEPIRLRGSPGFCIPGYDTNYIEEKYSKKKLVLNAGDAVVWTHRMFHGSMQNRSGKIRIAASQILIPEEANPILFHMNKDRSISIFNTSEDFFEKFEIGLPPPEKYLLEVIQNAEEISKIIF